MADDGISLLVELDTEMRGLDPAVKSLHDLDKTLKNIDGGTSKVTRATKEFSGHAEKTTSVLGKLERMAVLTATGFRGMGMAAGEAHQKTSEFLEFFGAVAAFEMLEKLVDKMKELGEEAIRSAAKAQRMNRVIDLASGGRAKGAENREFLEQFASGGKGYTGTEFTEEQSEGAFVDLKKVGMTDQRAKLAMKAAADIAAVSKNKDEAFGTAVEAFSRLHSMGRINSRSLIPLGLGVDDFKKLDRFKGKSNQDIQKAMESGKIDESDLYKLIMSRAGETMLGTAASKNADLLGTKLSKLSELPERFYKKLADTSAISTLSEALDGMLVKLDPNGPAGQRIFGALEATFTALADAVEGIDFDALADSISDDVVPAIKDLIALVKPTMDVIETTIHGFKVAADFIRGKKTPTEEVAAERAYDANQAALQGPSALGKAWAYLKSPFVRSAAGLADDEMPVETPMGTMSKAKWRKLGGDVAKGFSQGIDGGMSSVDQAMSSMGDTEPLRSTIDSHSPSRVFAELGRTIPAGVVEGVEYGSAAVDSAISRMVQTPTAPRAASGSVHAGPVSVEVHVHVDGASRETGEEMGEIVSRRLDEILPTTLQSAIEQLAAQTGSTG